MTDQWIDKITGPAGYLVTEKVKGEGVKRHYLAAIYEDLCAV